MLEQQDEVPVIDPRISEEATLGTARALLEYGGP